MRPNPSDFLEPIVINDLRVGWQVNWIAYHAACDAQDKPTLKVVGGKDVEPDGRRVT